jgi:hypothetical protein
MRYFVGLSLLLTLLAISPAGHATVEAAPYVVTDEAGLVAAIDAANAHPGPDTIVLEADINLTTNHGGDLNGLPVTEDDLIIRGGGHTLRRTAAIPFRHFEVSGAHLWLDDIVLENGDAGDENGGAVSVLSGGGLTVTRATIGGASGGNTAIEGGGIHCYGWSDLTLTDSTISHNTATEKGGGIATGGTSLTLVRSYVNDNRITGTTSGIQRGAGIYVDGGNVILVESQVNYNRFEGLTASWPYGGGISVYYGDEITLLNTQVNHNQAVTSDDHADGGGIYLYTASQVTLIASQVNHNRAESNGYTRGGGMLITNSALRIEDTHISNNTGVSTGGESLSATLGVGLYISSRPTQIYRSTISDNYGEMIYTGGSNHCCGGGLHARGGFLMVNTTVSGNRVHNHSDGIVRGGGILISSGLDISIINSTIVDNSVTGGTPLGGGIAREGSNLVEFANTIIANNTTSTGSNSNCVLFYSPHGPLTSNEYNLIDDLDGCTGFPGANDMVTTATLGPLADNSGPTLTHMPVSTPPLDSANPAVEPDPPASGVACPATDQRGAPRGTDQCDVGAVEAGAEAPIYNNAPIGMDDLFYYEPPGTPTTGVLDNDSDPDGDDLSAYPVSAPSKGFVTLDPDGTFTYTPLEGISGLDTFTYQACDARGMCSAAHTVTIVLPPPAGCYPAPDGSVICLTR